MLGSQDYRVVVAAIQMAVILIEKLPEVFLVYFQREGVVHAMEALKSIPLKALTTPKKPEEARSASPMILPLSQSEGEVSSSSSAETPLTPNTAKRSVDREATTCSERSSLAVTKCFFCFYHMV